MNVNPIAFLGGPHDGRAVKLVTVRPVVFLPANPEHLSLYTRCEGTPKAEYRLVAGRYVFAGITRPER